jgi:hypothetical protein
MPTMRLPVALSISLALAAVPGVALTGCAGSAVTRSARQSDMTVDQAEDITEAYRRRHETAVANPSPLRDPKSLDDVLEVLRLDEIDLFPGAVKYATNEGSPRGKALAAQILLAWGDAQHLLGHLLMRASQQLQATRDRLEEKNAAGKLSGGEQEKLARLNKSLEDLEGVERAMRLVGNRHIADGMKLAEQVISTSPNDYEGYRVAADFYRMREDWSSYDSMVKKIETLKPDSKGLVFLRAEEAWDRDHNKLEAGKLFKEALTRDPKFTRAQVALLIMQPDLAGAHAELQKLKEINPHHQIVVWMGPVLDHAYEAWKDTTDRHQNDVMDRALPGAQ